MLSKASLFTTIGLIFLTSNVESNASECKRTHANVENRSGVQYVKTRTGYYVFSPDGVEFHGKKGGARQKSFTILDPSHSAIISRFSESEKQEIAASSNGEKTAVDIYRRKRDEAKTEKKSSKKRRNAEKTQQSDLTWFEDHYQFATDILSFYLNRKVRNHKMVDSMSEAQFRTFVAQRLPYLYRDVNQAVVHWMEKNGIGPNKAISEIAIKFRTIDISVEMADGRDVDVRLMVTAGEPGKFSNAGSHDAISYDIKEALEVAIGREDVSDYAHMYERNTVVIKKNARSKEILYKFYEGFGAFNDLEAGRERVNWATSVKKLKVENLLRN